MIFHLVIFRKENQCNLNKKKIGSNCELFALLPKDNDDLLYNSTLNW